MTALRLWARFASVQGARATDVLSAVAFAFATAAALVVASGIGAFQARFEQGTGGDDAELILALSWLALALLLPAVATLAHAASKLAVARRDARLAALRLAGATRSQVSVLAGLDAAAQAIIGALVGIAIYAASIPLLSMLEFQGRPFAAGELVLPWWIVAIAVAAVLAVALIATATSLARVAVTPLGVAQRVTPKGLSWLRVALGLALLVGYIVIVASGLIQVGTAIMLIMLAATALTVVIVGPFLLWVVARIVAKAARRPATLVAARRLADDPRGAFNVVGAMSMAIFVGGFASLLPAFMADADGVSQTMLDTFVGTLLTIGIAGLLGAVLAGVAQAAKVLDQAGEHRALHLVGADVAFLRAARMRAVVLPLVVMVGTAMGTSLVLLLPAIRMWIEQPASILAWLAISVAAVVLVISATAASTPLLRRVATTPA